MTGTDSLFEARLGRLGAELRSLYTSLYPERDASFDEMVAMLRAMSAARPARLRELDRGREADPAWWRGHGIVGMMMYADAFAGDLKGVAAKLDYVRECGVRCLHLMPLLESPAGRSDGGYAVSDFGRVQPELGTMEDLAALTDKCHNLGISVCLDFVMNHTSEDHEWARRARRGEREYQDRYFFYDSWDIPNQFERTVPQVFPETAPGNFTFCPEAGKVVMTTFWPYQWDLNYANPVVFREMTAAMLNLCNHGVDIIRLDAVPYIWKELGTSCRNLPQVHTLVRMLRIVCELVCPGTLLLGEVVMEPSKVVPYFGTPERPECHLLYNVTTMASIWHTVATRDTGLLRHQLEQVFALPGHAVFLNYIRCHDDIGWGLDYAWLGSRGQAEVPHKRFLNDYFTGRLPGSPSRGELYNDDPRLGDARLCGTTASLCGLSTASTPAETDLAVRLDLMLHALILTLGGIPVLYSGDEIGRLNDEGYRGDPLKAGDSRYLHRGRMDWARAEERHDPRTVPGRIFSGLRALEAQRLRHPAFDVRADAWLLEESDPRLMGIGRWLDGEVLLALFNFGDADAVFRLPEPLDGEDLTTGEKAVYADVSLPARGFVWLAGRTDT